MKPLDFEDLAKLPVIQYYEAAFRKATGVSLMVAPPAGDAQLHRFASMGNLFCALAGSTSAGCAACHENERGVQQRVARKLTPVQIHCYAGLTVVAAPVLVGKRHVATLLGGQVFRREPTERDFLLVLKMLGDGPDKEWIQKARKSYFETPVLTADRFQAVLQLLEVFSQYLSDFASKQAIASSECEPDAVTNAKEFVQAHVEEPITLAQVVGHVHVSRFYFCKLFKKVTGLTLTEYIARVRVEKAKTLLVDPSRRISEVVFAAGFGSIPRFNSVFKRHVGMAPSEFRSSLRSGPTASA